MCIRDRFGLQSPINAQLSRSVGVLEGSFLSFLGGTLVLGIAVLLFGKGHVGGVFGVPAWQLVGGLLGATVVFNTILCVPHIGVLPTLMAMILGNLIMGCIICLLYTSGFHLWKGNAPDGTRGWLP